MKYNVISADSHVVEPPRVWTDYLDASWRSRAPHLVRKDGADVFVCEGHDLLRPSGMSLAGRAPGSGPQTFDEGVYPGAYQPDARLKDMAKDGIDAEVVYPSISMRLFEVPDVPLKQACFQAYNRWIAEFSAAQPDRIKAIAVMTLEDIEGAVTELKRASELGLVGAMTTVSSDDPGLYSQRTYDPFWAVAEANNLPVSLHVVTDQKAIAHNLVEHTMSANAVQRSLANMIFGGLFDRFPRLKMVSAENDAGWAGYFMERMDYLYRKRISWVEQSAIKGKGMLPSEYFKRNVYITFMTDKSGVYVRDLIGVEHLMWSSDYPHNDSTWPHSQRVIAGLFEGIPAADKNKIVAENAARLYHFA